MSKFFRKSCRPCFILTFLFLHILTLGVLSGAVPPNNNAHGLLRNPLRGTFIVPGSTDTKTVEATEPQSPLGFQPKEEEIDKSADNTGTTEHGFIGIEKEDGNETEILPQFPHFQDIEYDEDKNKTKRSKGFVTRLLQNLGLVKPGETRGRELEAQVMEEDGDGGDASDSEQTTPAAPPRSGILSSLNPITKITNKIHRARTAVNSALNFVGLGGSKGNNGGPEGQDDSMEAKSAGEESGDDGNNYSNDEGGNGGPALKSGNYYISVLLFLFGSTALIMWV